MSFSNLACKQSDLFGRSRDLQISLRLFGQTRVGVSLLAKSVISRANLELCIISVHAAVGPSRAPGAKEKSRAFCGVNPKSAAC